MIKCMPNKWPQHAVKKLTLQCEIDVKHCETHGTWPFIFSSKDVGLCDKSRCTRKTMLSFLSSELRLQETTGSRDEAQVVSNLNASKSNVVSKREARLKCQIKSNEIKVHRRQLIQLLFTLIQPSTKTI